MKAPVLLAVAVFDDGTSRLESAGIHEMNLDAHEGQVFRVSYRLADSAASRDEARIRVRFRIDGGAWDERQAAMQDRPLVRDDVLGSIEFTAPPLAPGRHVLDFQVDFETSRRKAASHVRRDAGAAGQVALTVAPNR